jgi:hypothetical protein
MKLILQFTPPTFSVTTNPDPVKLVCRTRRYIDLGRISRAAFWGLVVAACITGMFVGR